MTKPLARGEEIVRKLSVMLIAATAIAGFGLPASAELGSNIPTDMTLLTQREIEAGCTITPTTPPTVTCPSGSANVFNSGIFDIPSPPVGTKFKPAKRVPRDIFGVVGPAPLTLQDLHALVYPDATSAERQALLEGLTFFTTQHTPGEGGLPNDNGVGPINNQPFCLGCHLNAAEAVRSPGLLGPTCFKGSNCGSNVTRAARSTPTNFQITALDAETGGGIPPDNLNALSNTGKTAAFTTFGDFDPNHADAANNPTGIGFFDPLDGTTANIVTGKTSQPFGGFVQHVRPALPSDVCVPKPLPPVALDANLNGSLVPTGAFRRSVGERAGPPYIGRGLMEAVPTADILYFAANADPMNPTPPERENGKLGTFSDFACSATGCISGKANMIPRGFAVNTTGNNAGTVTGFVGGVGRFGLRANGVEILQFIVGGLQGELSFTSLFNPGEINFPTLFPGGTTTAPEPATCAAARSQTPGQPVNLATLEVHLSTPFSVRNFLRNTAPPEFGDALLNVLQSPRPDKSWRLDSKEGQVKRGAELFGIDLVAFADRTVGGEMKGGGDGRDDNAINTSDRKLNCVGCHTPIRRTGQSPTALTSSGVGSTNLSYKWAPIFSDLLLHKMPVIDAERDASMPRDVVVIPRLSPREVAEDEDRGGDHGNGKGQGDDYGNGKGQGDDNGNGKSKGGIVDTFDLPRNLADDTFTNIKASALGSEFRTAPLMGLGRIGPPFLHDARVYLSKDTVNGTTQAGKAPAGTVTTNRKLTNAPLVVRSVDDALLAAIELHDLPAPDENKNTPKVPGAGCPVPKQTTNVTETAADICPPYSSATSQANRSDAREVIRRFRGLSSDDQQAVIEFLKQL